MMKLLYTLTIVGVIFASCQAEAPRQRLRFPGPVNNKIVPFLAHQEVAAAAAPPYPPAGLKPEPAFELPTEEAANFPEPTYGPPDQTYGPPDQTYGPPEQTYGPPDASFSPPPEDNNALPQTASILDARVFFPQTQLTLPRTERLIAFRPQKRLRLAASQRRPQAGRQPSKLQQRPLTQASKPAKLIVSVGTRPQEGFAQLPPIARNPIFAGGRIIAYSERLQSW